MAGDPDAPPPRAQTSDALERLAALIDGQASPDDNGTAILIGGPQDRHRRDRGQSPAEVAAEVLGTADPRTSPELAVAAERFLLRPSAELAAGNGDISPATPTTTDLEEDL
jgi:hypothetical protein